jgi:hypothetical protein
VLDLIEEGFMIDWSTPESVIQGLKDKGVYEIKKLFKAEQELVLWMKSFGSIDLFTKNNRTYYLGIRKNFLYLLDEAFPSRTKRSPNTKKQELLDLAKSGADKPKRTTKLRQTLFNYTKSSQLSYDPEFTKQIKTLRPDWFVGQSDLANTKKQELLDLAKSGADKPSQKTKLGKTLPNYTVESSGSYDPEFTKQIKTLRPDWFENTANTKKQELLELARSGADKPSQKTKLGQALCSYTIETQRCYDPEFTKKIKAIRPDWFISKSDLANTKKQELLETAKNGKVKPHYSTKLGSAFRNYTGERSGCYDPKFTKQIKAIRPDWFISKSNHLPIKNC